MATETEVREFIERARRLAAELCATAAELESGLEHGTAPTRESASTREDGARPAVQQD